MKRFLIFLVVLGVALAGLNAWWQRNATRVIAMQVTQLCQGFFVNPQKLAVRNDPVRMIGLREARIAKLVVQGDDLVLRGGPRVAHVKLVLRDVDVSGPPFHFIGVGGGSYTVTITDDAVTQFLRQRGISFGGGGRIPLDTLAVAFSRKTNTTVAAQLAVPLLGEVPVSATGTLMPSRVDGSVDFRILTVALGKASIGHKLVRDTLGRLNPIITVSDWPLISQISRITTGDGTVAIQATVTGINPSLLP